MPADSEGSERAAWVVTLAAAAILMVTMGARQTLGLFISPIKSSTGLSIGTISLALAFAQLMWGAIQPIAGAVADRYGPAKVLIAGLLVMATGTALTPFMGSGLGLVASIGILSASGAGAGSFSVLIGAASRHLLPENRGKAAGIINAGGSLGQFVFAPLAQALIQLLGWMGAMWSLALISVAALPLVRVLNPGGPAHRADSKGSTPWKAVWDAVDDRSYLLLNAGFFTCGFHVAFLVTHLPGEVNLCGLPPSVASWSLALIGLANIVGSLMAGAFTQRLRSKYILAAMYGSRALLIGGYLIAPKTVATFYVFAVGLGLTWLATIPPTATIVGKLFGIRYLSTLFGLTLLSHQIGAFLGAFLGGLVLVKFGDYHLMWYADMALAAAAALINLPIREARMAPVAAA
ncbi:MAG TPA: MFS transporter [Steroidobacteraceae bacterium]|jgi:predicted MFS family arabinose efflux permease|nr:MFS transporter [Steroidobacteraceae bacterium]